MTKVQDAFKRNYSIVQGTASSMASATQVMWVAAVFTVFQLLVELVIQSQEGQGEKVMTQNPFDLRHVTDHQELPGTNFDVG